MRPGLWANIHAKRKRGEKMRKKGEKGAPTPDAIARAKGESNHPNIWDNIRKRRAAGKPRLKPGEKGYPKTLDLPEATSESTIRDNRPDHEIMHGAHGDARRKHDAVHGHGSYHKLPADQKIKLHRKEIDQRFADRGRKPPKYTVKHTGNKVGHVGSFEIHHTPLQKVRDRLRTPTKVSEEMMTSADAGIPQDTKNMGPRLKTVNVTDRRRRKDRVPVLLKRFRKYFDDNS